MSQQTIATRKTLVLCLQSCNKSNFGGPKKGSQNIFLQMASMTFKVLKYWLGDLLWHSLISEFNRNISEDDKNLQKLKILDLGFLIGILTLMVRLEL